MIAFVRRLVLLFCLCCVFPTPFIAKGVVAPNPVASATLCLENLLGKESLYCAVTVVETPLLDLKGFSQFDWRQGMQSRTDTAVCAASSLPIPKDVYNNGSVAPQEIGNMMNNAARFSYIENKGQWPDSILYCARSGGLTTWITRTGVVYDFHRRVPKPGMNENTMLDPHFDPRHAHDSDRIEGHVVKMRFVGGQTIAQHQGLHKRETYHNYFLGQDSSKWRSRVPLWGEVRLQEVYAGVDVRLYEEGGAPRFDYIVRPGADASQIALDFEGADGVHTTADGRLALGTSLGEVALQGLYAYQEQNGKRVQVACAFRVENNGSTPPTTSFALGDYNPTLPLVIDPLVYSTYIGSPAGLDQGWDVKVNASAESLVVGQANTGYPTTIGAYQTTFGGGVFDITVTKLNASGNTLVFSTFLGGSGGDVSTSVHFNGMGEIFVAGGSSSTDYPTTAGAFQTVYGGGGNDIVVTKLTSDGSSMIYSTYIGGSGVDVNTRADIDGFDNIYIAGITNGGFPTIIGSYQTTYGGGPNDIIVAKLNALGNTLLYSTYIGGSDDDRLGNNIIVDPATSEVVISGSSAANYPITAGAYQTAFGGGTRDIVITRLNASGTALLHSTFIGGPATEGTSCVTMNAAGEIIVVANIDATGYPTTAGAYQTSYGGGTSDIVLSKLNTSLSTLIYSTYIGGANTDFVYGVALDASEAIYIAGASGGGYPTTAGAFQTVHGGALDVVISKLNASASSLLYSTYIGGIGTDAPNSIALDASANIYLVGRTASTNYPITAGAFQTTYAGGTNDFFVTKYAILSSTNYTWSGAPGAPWTVAANWTPARTTPLSSDILHFPAGAHTPTNVPSETIEQMTLAAGATVTLQGSAPGNALAVGAGGVQIPAGATLDVGAINSIGLNIGLGGVLAVSGILNMRALPVVGTGGFTLQAGSTFVSERTDAINGTSAGTGAVQVTGTIFYSPMASYEVGTPSLAVSGQIRLNPVAGKPAINQAHNLTTRCGTGYWDLLRNLTLTGRLFVANGIFAVRRRLNLNGAGSVVAGTMEVWNVVPGNELNNNGGLTVQTGGSMQFWGTTPGIVNGMEVQYQSGSTLRYSGAFTKTATSEFPSVMNGNVIIGNPTTVTTNPLPKTVHGATNISGRLILDTTYTTQGALNLQTATSRIELNNQTLQINGNVSFVAATTDLQGNGSLSIGGTGTIAGTLTHTGDITNFTMNRPGANLVVANILRIANTLALVNGTIQPTTGEVLITNTNFGAILGGSSTAFIRGPLRRALLPNVGADGADYFFPVGAGTTYQPLWLRNVRTGAAADTVGVQAFTSGAISSTPPFGGTLPRNWQMANSLLNGYQSSTVELDAGGVPAGYGVGMASGAQSGPYSSIVGTTAGATRFSAAQAAIAPVAPGTPNARYFAFGGVGPVITGFSPQTVNSGDTVTITGFNFSSVSAVGFGGVPTPFTLVSPTEIRAVAGAGATGVVSLVSAFGVGTSSANITFANAPAIASVSPNYGTTGATVQIFGERLSTLTQARFGGVNARAFSAVSATQATAILDTGATGAVEVVTPSGVASLSNGFTFYRTPSIADFTPRVARAGDTVRISGAEFSGVRAVRFGLTPAASFSVVSPNLITAVLPANAETSRIVVENLVGRDSATSSPELTVVAPPAISSVTPLALGVNQTFTALGAEFHPNLVVRIGTVTAASVQRTSLGQIQFSFSQATTGVLTIIASGGTVSFAAPLAVLAPPTISGFSPPTPRAGETVTVSGTNFPQQGALVSVGGVPVQATVNSSTQITISLPAAASGLLRVLTAGGEATSATALNPLRAPIILDVQPPSARSGSVVEIRGENLFPTQSVAFGEISASFSVDTARGLVRAVVPAASQTQSSAAIVRLSTPGGVGVAPFTFQILPPAGAVLTGFEPQSLVEGEMLRVFGVELSSAATVRLNGVVVTAATLEPSGGELRFVVPRGVVPDNAFSTSARVSVEIGAYSTSAAVSVEIRGAGTPLIRSFSPSAGNAETVVALTGENFGVPPRGEILEARIGGVLVRAFTVLSTTQVRIVPGNVPSGVISLRTPAGEISTTLPFRFDSTLAPQPSVAAQDSLALEALFAATGGERWTQSATWALGSPIASRLGVKVENGRVVELRLPNNNLQGTLPAEVLRALSALRILDLSANALRADADGLCALAGATEVNLSGNRFDGTLDALCCLRGVPLLNVSSNNFSGGLPNCFGESERLEIFDASRNRLGGALPASLGNARALRVLNLSGNEFTGAIPAAWGEIAAARIAAGGAAAKNAASTENLEGLQTLDLSGNRLSGEIPASLGLLRSLRELRLNDNALEGAAPRSLVNAQRLVTLDARRNRLSDLPPLSEIPRLDSLRVEGNALPFDALERQLGAPLRVFSYAPQTPSLPQLRDTVGVGDAPLALRYAARGENNRYIWLRNGSPLGAPSQSGELLLPALGAADTGAYSCRVVNTLLPDLVLESNPMRVGFSPPTDVPQGAIRLVYPEADDVEVPRAPQFAWTNLAGAASYTLEVSLESNFSAILARRTFAQSVETLQSGVARGVVSEDSAFALPALTRVFWRVRASNSRGDGEWTSGEFTTATGNAALSVSAAHFGKIPLADSAARRLVIRNLSPQSVRIQSIRVRANSAANPSANPFRISALAGESVLPSNNPDGISVEAVFAPSDLAEARADVVIAYVVGEDSTTVQTQIFAGRLRGRGSALKIIPPQFDTLLVGAPKIAAAQMVNVSRFPAVLRRARLASALRQAQGVRGESPYATLSPEQEERIIEAGDTLAFRLRGEARALGALPADDLICEFFVADERDTLETALRSFGRLRSASDVVARFGARVTPESAPPGTRVQIEVYIAEGDFARMLNSGSLPTARGSLRFSSSVLALAPDEISVRRRNPSDTSDVASYSLPQTFWEGRDSVLYRIPALAVAGRIDSTVVAIEDILWGGSRTTPSNLQLSAFADGRFRSLLSNAGGIRRIAPRALAPRIVHLSPNPAKEALEIRYFLPESGFVEIALLNVKGEVAQWLTQEVQARGEHTLQARVDRLPSGSYTVRVRFNGQTETRQARIVR